MTATTTDDTTAADFALTTLIKSFENCKRERSNQVAAIADADAKGYLLQPGMIDQLLYFNAAADAYGLANQVITNLSGGDFPAEHPQIVAALHRHAAGVLTSTGGSPSTSEVANAADRHAREAWARIYTLTETD